MTKSEKIKQAEELRKFLNKTYGKDVLMIGKDAMEALNNRIIPTASLEVNKALYCGGFSGIVELFGPPASGKTSLAIETLAINQKLDPDFMGLWLETEGSVDPSILEQFGVDMDRLMFVGQEQVDTAENLMDISVGAAQKGIPDMIICNSIAGLAPKKETEDDLDKQQVGLTARLMSKYFRVITGPLKKNKITAIYINQLRDKIGVTYGDPSTTTGGRALGFYANQRLRLNSLKIQSSDPITPEEGIKVSVIVNKNRLSGVNNPYTRCEYYARFGVGIDSMIALPDLLVEAGIFTKSGSWFNYEVNGAPAVIEGVECKFRSGKLFSQALRENNAFAVAMQALLESNGKQTILTNEEIQKIEEEQEKINSFVRDNIADEDVDKDFKE